MNVSQFFDRRTREFAKILSPTISHFEERLMNFRPYAREMAERFEWTDKPQLGLEIRQFFEADNLTLEEAREFLVWTVDEFCEDLLDPSRVLNREKAMTALEHHPPT
jgi:hypothetical protein